MEHNFTIVQSFHILCVCVWESRHAKDNSLYNPLPKPVPEYAIINLMKERNIVTLYTL